MGNDGSKQECNARLKTKKYPSNIPEKEWKPIEVLSRYKQDKEGIVSSNGDQRIRATPNDYKNKCKQIYNIGRLKMEYSSNSNENEQKNTEDIKHNSYHFGTGFIIHHQLHKSFILTAAHNLVHIEKYNKNKLSFPEFIWFEINENKYKGFQKISTYPVVRRYIHPKYIKYCKENNIPEEATGFDIAIVEVMDTTNTLQKIKPFQIRSHNSSLLNHSDIKIIGFPGEESKLGELYGMKGNCMIKYLNDSVALNKLIIYSNIDTSDGQSGSPIFNVKTNIYSKKLLLSGYIRQIKTHQNITIASHYDIYNLIFLYRYNQKLCGHISCFYETSDDDLYESYYDIIGVHVAGDKKNKFNFGTFINDDILKWIYDVIGVHCNEYDKYAQCNALLITSSKTKYAKCLDKIHEKFVKTTIINTVKLYYDYNDDENVNNISKEDILKCIKNTFTHHYELMNNKMKGKRFIIYFCGESDGYGNWLINDDINDVITLNDIMGLYQYLDCARKLFIISDCPQSGNWVKKLTELREQSDPSAKKGIVIQASCQSAKSCNIGVFTEKYAGACLAWVKERLAKTDIPKIGTRYLAAAVASATVGFVYDGIVKQSIHKITKYSQPMSSTSYLDWIKHIGETHDGYEVLMYFYNSWGWMDQTITFENGCTIGGLATSGLY